MKPNETNQHKPPNQAVIEASRYAAEIFPDPTQQGTAVQYFLSQPWTATRNDVETFQRVRSTIDAWAALPETDRIRWTWTTPKTPVPICPCGALTADLVDDLCVQCRYGKYLNSRLTSKESERVAELYREHHKLVYFVINRTLRQTDIFPTIETIKGRREADALVKDLSAETWMKVTANISKYTDQGFKITAWLGAVAEQVVRDYMKKDNRRRHLAPMVPNNDEHPKPSCRTAVPTNPDDIIDSGDKRYQQGRLYHK